MSILTAPELIQFGLVKPGTLYQCTKTCHGLREAPKLWEESVFITRAYGLSFELHALHVHQQFDYQMRDFPDLAAFGECARVAAILVYVDDFLAVGPRHVLQTLLTQLQHVWKGSISTF